MLHIHTGCNKQTIYILCGTLGVRVTMSEHSVVQLKMAPFFLLRFRSLRATHLVNCVKNPRAKPRHEKIDVELFTQKKEESYIDLKEDYCVACAFYI